MIDLKSFKFLILPCLDDLRWPYSWDSWELWDMFDVWWWFLPFFRGQGFSIGPPSLTWEPCDTSWQIGERLQHRSVFENTNWEHLGTVGLGDGFPWFLSVVMGPWAASPSPLAQEGKLPILPIAPVISGDTKTHQPHFQELAPAKIYRLVTHTCGKSPFLDANHHPLETGTAWYSHCP